jgi:hypothetical protein
MVQTLTDLVSGFNSKNNLQIIFEHLISYKRGDN